MTDKEIIKALECCVKAPYCSKKTDCPYKGIDNCVKKHTLDAIDLINRQQADLEFAKKINALQMEELQKAQAEIERLNSPVLIIDNVDLSENEIAEKLRNLPVQIFPDNEEQIRNEAIKEFAERLKKEYTETFLVSGDTVIEILDNLVKETEGDAE